MPSNKPFIDRFAQIGRAKLAPISEEFIAAKSPSRSLFIAKKDRTIHLEIKKDGSLHIDTSAIIGDKIKVNKRYAIKLAEWIIRTYDRR